MLLYLTAKSASDFFGALFLTLLLALIVFLSEWEGNELPDKWFLKWFGWLWLIIIFAITLNAFAKGEKIGWGRFSEFHP